MSKNERAAEVKAANKKEPSIRVQANDASCVGTALLLVPVSTIDRMHSPTVGSLCNFAEAGIAASSKLGAATSYI